MFFLLFVSSSDVPRQCRRREAASPPMSPAKSVDEPSLSTFFRARSIFFQWILQDTPPSVGSHVFLRSCRLQPWPRRTPMLGAWPAWARDLLSLGRTWGSRSISKVVNSGFQRSMVAACCRGLSGDGVCSTRTISNDGSASSGVGTGLGVMVMFFSVF
jgi:hypothetical protein